MQKITRPRGPVPARAAAPVAILLALVAVAALVNGFGHAAAPSATSASTGSTAASSGQPVAAAASGSARTAAQSGASQTPATVRPTGSASGTSAARTSASASAVATGRAPGSTPAGAAPTPSAPAPDATPLPPVTAGPQRLAACSAIPASVAESVLGAGAKSVVVPAGGWVGGQCTWTGPKGSFLLMLGDAASFKATGDPVVTDAASRLEAFRVNAGPDAAAVTGIGTAAEKAPGEIAGYRGESYAEIMGIGIPDDRLPDLLKAALGV